MTINYEVRNTGEFLDKLLSLLSFLHTPLTDMESLVLKSFLCLPPKFRYHRFSSSGRKAVIKSLAEVGVKLSPANLNNRLYSLIEKKYLRRDEDNVIYTAEFLEKIVYLYDQNKKFNFNLNFIEARSNTTTNTTSSGNTGD